MTRAPLCSVLPGWVDHYGHMNLAYYLVAFDLATDALWPSLGLGPSFRAQGLTTDTAHVLVDSNMTRETLYVAMTRGRDANVAYVAVDKPDATHGEPHPGDGDGVTGG